MLSPRPLFYICFINQACKTEELGKVDFDQVVKERQQTVYVPNWFTVDLKTGMLTVHLAQDENDCLSAWVSARWGLLKFIVLFFAYKYFFYFCLV